MAMNREQKRLLQKQGALDAEGQPKATRRQPTAPRPKEQRTKPRQFLREVRSELRKVAWPNRKELGSYTVVVLVLSTVLTLLIWGFDLIIRDAIINTLG